MPFVIPLLAALGCAVCNGTAAVLQKVSADKETAITKAELGVLFRLIKDWPYVLGGALDVFAWGLTLLAVHSLPLFIVQPIIALSVLVTLVIENKLFHRHFNQQMFISVGLILLGLVLLALSASPEIARPLTAAHRLIIVLAPAVIGLAVALLARLSKPFVTIMLAALAGTSFGGIAIVGRALVITVPYWRIALNPLFLAMLAYGVVGILTFTIALQRHHASVVNAAMIAFETIVPIFIGIVLLGDAPRNGAWGLVIGGTVAALAGTLFIASSPSKNSLV